LLNQERLIRTIHPCGGRIFESLREIAPEALERESLAFGAAAPHVQQMICRYTERPRLERADAAEGRQLRDDPQENFLRRIFGVGRMPQHPDRQIVDILPGGRDERLERLTIARFGALCKRFERGAVHAGHARRAWMTPRNTRSSSPSAATCASKSPAGMSAP